MARGRAERGGVVDGPLGAALAYGGGDLRAGAYETSWARTGCLDEPKAATGVRASSSAIQK